jgi:hypothetical protein
MLEDNVMQMALKFSDLVTRMSYHSLFCILELRSLNSEAKAVSISFPPTSCMMQQPSCFGFNDGLCLCVTNSFHDSNVPMLYQRRLSSISIIKGCFKVIGG